MPGKLFYSGPPLAVLHEEYAKKGIVDEAAPVKSSSTTVIDAPVHQVWEVLSDLANWPAWHSPITILELGAVRPDASFRWKIGGAPIRSTFAVVTPDRELSWTGRFLAFKAVDRHLLRPTGPGRTEVTMAESMAGPLLPLLYNTAKLRAGHERWLADLKQKAEDH
jgi:hypothetical protein